MNRNIYNPSLSDIHSYLKKLLKQESTKHDILQWSNNTYALPYQKRKIIIVKSLLKIAEKAASESNPGGLFEGLKNLPQ